MGAFLIVFPTPGVPIQHLRGKLLAILDVHEAVLFLLFRLSAECIEIALKHNVTWKKTTWSRVKIQERMRWE